MSTERDPQASSKLAMKEVAYEWSETPILYAESGNFSAYDQMSQEFLRRTQERVAHSAGEHATKQLVETGAAYGGFNVVGRYLYAGAEHAVLQGYSQEQLKRALYMPGSFRSLQLLTREWNDSAVAIEHETGLNGFLFQDDLRIRHGFTLDEDAGLTINDFPILSYRARGRMIDSGSIDERTAFSGTDTVRCIGHTAGVLAYVYKYLLEVADTDPSLFKATLEKRTQQSDQMARGDTLYKVS